MPENPGLLLIELHDAEKRAGASEERLASIRARFSRFITRDNLAAPTSNTPTHEESNA